jgi:hypothetical protein
MKDISEVIEGNRVDIGSIDLLSWFAAPKFNQTGLRALQKTTSAETWFKDQIR